MRKQLVIGLCSMVLALSACDSWIDPNVNINPTQPETASYDVVLPVIQASSAYVMGGDFGRFASVLTQHNYGLDRQHLGIYNYQFTESDVNNAWEGIYSGPLSDLKILIDRSVADGAPHYTGLFQVLYAYNMLTVTDLWGDVPNSAALQGAANTQPAYDAQQKIYTDLSAMVDEAIVNLSAATSAMSPRGDDLMFGGDRSAWTKAAYGLKARLAIHRVKRDGSAAQEALSAAQSAMGSNDDDWQFYFGTAQTEANPWFQFDQQRGDVTFGPKLAEIMNATSDPRLPFYAIADDDGAYTTNSWLGPFYTSVNSAVPFLTYTEMKFIAAEARMRSGDKSGAHTDYVEAIRASLSRTGVSDADADTYVSQSSVDPGADALTLEHIMTQKYIAMYTQSESYTDWRRSGVPALTPVSGSDIPRRFAYPQSERLYNGGNMPSGLTIFSRVWWDVE